MHMVSVDFPYLSFTSNTVDEERKVVEQITQVALPARKRINEVVMVPRSPATLIAQLQLCKLTQLEGKHKQMITKRRSWGIEKWKSSEDAQSKTNI